MKWRAADGFLNSSKQAVATKQKPSGSKLLQSWNAMFERSLVDGINRQTRTG